VEHLALSLGISIITSINLTIARKSGLWNLGIDGIILCSIMKTAAIVLGNNN